MSESEGLLSGGTDLPNLYRFLRRRKSWSIKLRRSGSRSVWSIELRRSESRSESWSAWSIKHRRSDCIASRGAARMGSLRDLSQVTDTRSLLCILPVDGDESNIHGLEMELFVCGASHQMSSEEWWTARLKISARADMAKLRENAQRNCALCWRCFAKMRQHHMGELLRMETFCKHDRHC